MPAWKHSRHSHMHPWHWRDQLAGQVYAPQPWHPATGPAHGEGGHGELLEPRLGNSCLRTLTQDEGAIPDAMPATGQPSVTSVPSTSGGHRVSVVPACPDGQGVPGSPSVLGLVASSGGASPAQVMPARFLPSPWSRRDRLGNPIMVRLRRRVDFGFIAVSVLNRE